MPTFDATETFQRDYGRLSEPDKQRFLVAMRAFVADLQAIENGSIDRFRPGLRVKRVQGFSGVWELTWAPDGRATFSYGDQIQTGLTHIQWRRCGSHSIFRHA